MAFNAAGASAGAAAGTAIMPGWGTAIGAVLGGFMGGGGSSGGVSGGGAETKPMASAAQAAAFGSGIDGSGWIINFGDNNRNDLDNRQDKTITSTGPSADASANPKVGAPDPYSAYGGYLDGGAGVGLFESVNPLIWLALAGAVIYRLNKSKG